MRQSTVLPSFPAPAPLTIHFRTVLRYDAGNFPHALRGWLSARAYGHSSTSSLVKPLCVPEECEAVRYTVAQWDALALEEAIIVAHGADVLKITGAHLPHLGYQEYDTGHGKLSAHLDLREQKDLDTLRGLVRPMELCCQYQISKAAKSQMSGEKSPLCAGPRAIVYRL
jgi:hypothetical protein